jgi:hypothetical protein
MIRARIISPQSDPQIRICLHRRILRSSGPGLYPHNWILRSGSGSLSHNRILRWLGAGSLSPLSDRPIIRIRIFVLIMGSSGPGLLSIIRSSGLGSSTPLSDYQIQDLCSHIGSSDHQDQDHCPHHRILRIRIFDPIVGSLGH